MGYNPDDRSRGPWILLEQTDSFSMVLAVAVAIQGAIFAGVQSTGLGYATDYRCSVISQVVWTGNYFPGLHHHTTGF